MQLILTFSMFVMSLSWLLPQANAQTPVRSVDLTWVGQNGFGETFTVERADKTCLTATNADYVQKATNITEQKWTDTPVAPGDYCYRVYATLINPLRKSAPSNTAGGLVDMVPPANLSIKVSVAVTVTTEQIVVAGAK